MRRRNYSLIVKSREKRVKVGEGGNRDGQVRTLMSKFIIDLEAR